MSRTYRKTRNAFSISVRPRNGGGKPQPRIYRTKMLGSASSEFPNTFRAPWVIVSSEGKKFAKKYASHTRRQRGRTDMFARLIEYDFDVMTDAAELWAYDEFTDREWYGAGWPDWQDYNDDLDDRGGYDDYSYYDPLDDLDDSCDIEDDLDWFADSDLYAF